MQYESEYMLQRRAKMLGLAPGKEANKPAKIKPVSRKRIALNKDYRKLAKHYLTTHPICEVRGCNKPGIDLHHKRGRVGDLLLNPDYFMSVCRDHHTEIELSPEWAKGNGYSQSRLKS